MTIIEFDILLDKGEKKINPKRVIKTMNHCYDGCGWNMCDFWWIDGNKESRCSLFGDTIKFASEELYICRKIYGCHYEGGP